MLVSVCVCMTVSSKAIGYISYKKHISTFHHVYFLPPSFELVWGDGEWSSGHILREREGGGREREKNGVHRRKVTYVHVFIHTLIFALVCVCVRACVFVRSERS